MTPAASERYRRAQAIVHDVLERPLDERAAYIETACAGDAALRSEVEWLISAIDIAEPQDAFARTGHVVQAILADASIEAAAPCRYRLLERIGEGGMGQVWRAERNDGSVRQLVALKLLRGSGTANAGSLARLAAEGRILAALNHPNIAHFLDAGQGGNGEPFLAVEYVDGERIDRWCNAHALNLRERVELFLKVCSAVEYAHAQLVIHRDLKPANILVTAAGEPKLLDFGIARLIDADTGSARATTAVRAMTLAYASPEQIEGGLLGTASDIYSLGVVLYELIAGVRPFEDESDHSLSNAIVSGEIVPPSRRAANQVRHVPTSRRLAADIDAIVLKALRREPAQRYASAAALGDDLRRFLAARPVLARRGHWGYRARRFIWRNRWALGVATVVAALATTFALERERQLHRAELERDRAQAVARFTADMFDSAGSLPARGNTVSVRAMLDLGATDLQRRSDLPDEIKGSLLLTMGRAYNSMGLGQQAMPLLASAQGLLASNEVDRANVLQAIGYAWRLQGEYPKAIDAFTEAIALLRALPGDHADEIDSIRLRIVSMRADLVNIPEQDNIRELENIVAALENTPDRSDGLRVIAYSTVADVYRDTDAERAIPAAERAAGLAERLYGRDDVRTSATRAKFADALMNIEPKHAASLYGELIADYRRFTSTPSMRLAVLHFNQGKSLRYSDQPGAAATALEEAVAIGREVGGSQHRITLSALDELGVAYNQSGEPTKTETLLTKALPDFVEAARNGDEVNRDCYAMALATLGDAERIDHHYDEAAVHLAQADDILSKLDAKGFADDMLDLLQWSTQLHLDRRDETAARVSLQRYDAVLNGMKPVPVWRAAKSRELRAQLSSK